MWSFMTVLFHLECFQSSSTLLYVSVLCFFLLPSNVPLYESFYKLQNTLHFPNSLCLGWKMTKCSSILGEWGNSTLFFSGIIIVTWIIYWEKQSLYIHSPNITQLWFRIRSREEGEKKERGKEGELRQGMKKKESWREYFRDWVIVH